MTTTQLNTAWPSLCTVSPVSTDSSHAHSIFCAAIGHVSSAAHFLPVLVVYAGA